MPWGHLSVCVRVRHTCRAVRCGTVLRTSMLRGPGDLGCGGRFAWLGFAIRSAPPAPAPSPALLDHALASMLDGKHVAQAAVKQDDTSYVLSALRVQTLRTELKRLNVSLFSATLVTYLHPSTVSSITY